MDKFRCLFFLGFLSLFTQNGISQEVEFFEKCGDLPVIRQYEDYAVVYDSATSKNITKKITVTVTLDEIAVNSNGVMVGIRRRKKQPDIKCYLYISNDGGKTWQDITTSVPIPISFPQMKSYDSVFSIDDVFYIVNYHDVSIRTLIRSDDNGKTWTPLYHLYGFHSIGEKDLLCFAQQKKIIYLESSKGTGESTDFGVSWVEVSPKPVEAFIPTGDWIMDKALFWRGEEESILLKAGIWDSKHQGQFHEDAAYGFHINGHIYGQGSIYGKVTPDEFTRIRNPTKIFENQTVKSIDGGETWQIVNSNVEIEELLFVDCNGQIYGITNQSEGLKIFRAGKDAENWRKLTGIPTSMRIMDYVIGGDGRVYFYGYNRDYSYGDKSVYRSKIELCCGYDGKPTYETKCDYGVTIITHGIMPPNVINYSEDNWVRRMANAILDKVEQGNIYYCDADNGKLELIKSKGDNPEQGEKIVLFDWSKYCGLLDPIYGELAAEKLYLALAHLNEPIFKNTLKDAHFIGEGFGALVNSLTIKKLYQFDKNNISVDHVTHLVPREYNNKNEFLYHLKVWEGMYTEVYQREYKEYPFEENLARYATSELIKKLAKRFDKKYTKGSKVAERLADILDELDSFLNGETAELDITLTLEDISDAMDLISPISVTDVQEFQNLEHVVRGIDFAYQANLKEEMGVIIPYDDAVNFAYDKADIKIYPDIYTNTISTSSYGEGKGGLYALSRLNGGQDSRDNSRNSYGSAVLPLNLKEDGILNGELGINVENKSLPAWSSFKTDISLSYGVQVKNGGILMHDYFYMPNIAEKLALHYQTNGNIKKGTITVDFYDLDGKIIGTEAISFTSDEPSYILVKTIPINEDIKNKVVSFSLFFNGEPLDIDKGDAAMFINHVELR